MLSEQAAEDLQVRGVLRPPGEERLRPHPGLLLLLGQRDGRELHGEVGEQDHVLHSQCLRSGHVNRCVTEGSENTTSQRGMSIKTYFLIF